MPILELWASPPGTGKTRACIELFRESLLTSKAGIESRSFFILPSREHAERIQHLVLKTGIPGLFNAHILTVNDFTARSLGFSSGRRPTDAVRRFILKEILEGTDWKCFAEVKDTKGFLRLLMDTLKEFKAGLLTVEEFERRAQPLLKDPVFRSKFRDISVVWKNYEQSLESLGLKESEDEIAQLVLRRQKASLDLVIFDGFYHFTRAQERLMEWMASSARRMVVTLTLPSDAYRRGLFGYPARTREALRRIGFKEGKNFPRGNLRASRGALRHLEENVFAERPRLYRGDDETAIHIQEASSEEQEMELVAREIRRLYRESPLHYADVCVILRSLSGREKVMESVFRRFGIPFFIHERKKLIEHGFTATLSRFLDVFLEGWRREDLLFVLKSSYLAEAVSFEAAAELETASFRRSVREGKEAWLGLLDLGDVSSPAKALLRFVREWEERFLSSKGAGEFERNVFLLLRSFAMGGEEAGSFPGGKERVDEEAGETLRDIFKVLREAYRDRPFDSAQGRPFLPLRFMKELQESLEAGLFSLTPEGKNRVQVYDAVLALPKEYKAVFVAGLLEKAFPKEASEDPLLKDDERRVINKRGVVLEERLWRLEGERYFFYMAVTRATERLYLTYPSYDAGGRPTLPSFFVEEVKKCFEKLPVVSKGLGDWVPGPEEWESESDVTKGLAFLLFQKESGGPFDCAQGKGKPLSPFALAGLKAKLEKGDFREVIRAGLFPERACLEDARVKAFFAGLRGPFSATKIEAYATCPFKYFAGRVLNLTEPPEGHERRQMGTILHKILEEFYGRWPREKWERGEFPEASGSVMALLRGELRSLLEKGVFEGEPLYRRRVYAEEMEEVLRFFLEEDRKVFEKRKAVPSYFELEFGGDGKASFGFLKIGTGSGETVSVEGKIDRVDLVDGGGRAVVLDYKLSKREMSLASRLERGIEFQIPIYLLAVRRLLGVEPAGGELRFLRNGGAEGLYREEAREVLGLHRNTKTIAEREWEELLSRAERRVGECVDRLRSADISVRSKTCTYCPFSSVCRFEPWKLVYKEGG